MNNLILTNKLKKNDLVLISIFIIVCLIIFSMAYFFIFQKNKIAKIKLLENQQEQVLEQSFIDKTSYYLAIPQETKQKVIKPITIFFTGDINFDRHVREQASKQGNYNYIFDNIRSLFGTADLIVANLEGSISNYDSISVGSQVGSTNNYFFTFAPETAKVLQQENIELVSIGNNHILNFGQDGLDQTKKYLTSAGVDYFGHTTIEQNFEDEIFIKDFDGYKVLFVNYNQFINTDFNQLLKSIQDMRENVDYIVVYTHWGNEYQTIANNVIQELAHQFIDAGADLIIGSHPHVVQQSEIYQDKKIYYSLGNFIFDQYFSNEVREGMIVSVEINPTNNDTRFKEYKTLIKLDSSIELVNN